MSESSTSRTSTGTGCLPPLPYGHVVSLRADPDDDVGSLLCAPDGQVPARLTLRDDDGDRVAARVQPIVRPLAAVLAQARHDLAGLRLDTRGPLWILGMAGSPPPLERRSISRSRSLRSLMAGTVEAGCDMTVMTAELNMRP